MRSKFSTSAISGLLLLGSCIGAGAQSPTPAKVGYIRFWDMLPPANGVFEVYKAGAPASEGALFSGTAYQYTSYTEVPTGRYRLAVTKKGDAAALKTFDVEVKQDSFFTILLSPHGGVITAELIDDTPDPKMTSGTLIARNYFSGVTVSVAANTQKLVDALPYGQSIAANGIARARVPLKLTFKLANGTIAESTAEGNFQHSQRVTLLIIPDSYGRFCIRVTNDGTNL